MFTHPGSNPFLEKRSPLIKQAPQVPILNQWIDQQMTMMRQQMITIMNQAKEEDNKTNKTKRGYGRRKTKKKTKNKTNYKFSILGNNVRGIKRKIESLMSSINSFDNPSCILLQETLLQSTESVGIPGYQVFTKNRKGKGGGILTAVHGNLKPIVVSEAMEEEILTVQIKVNKKYIRVINAYAPQEDEERDKLLNFWQHFER